VGAVIVLIMCATSTILLCEVSFASSRDKGTPLETRVCEEIVWGGEGMGARVRRLGGAARWGVMAWPGGCRVILPTSMYKHASVHPRLVKTTDHILSDRSIQPASQPDSLTEQNVRAHIFPD